MGVVYGQCGGGGEGLQHQQVGFGEQAVFIILVDQFDGADSLVLHSHRGTQNGTCPEAGGIIHGLIKIGILHDIADHAAGPAGNTLADNTFPGLEGDAANINGASAGLAYQPVAPVREHEERATLGLDELYNQVKCLLDCFLDIEGDGQVAAHLGEQLQVS